MSFKKIMLLITVLFITTTAFVKSIDSKSAQYILALTEITTVGADESVVLHVFFLNSNGEMIDVPIGSEGGKLTKNSYRVEGSLYTEKEGLIRKSGDFISIKQDLGDKGEILINRGIRSIKLEFIPFKRNSVDKDKKIGVYNVCINVNGTHMKSNDFLIFSTVVSKTEN